jgi:hypothetical protein
MSPNPENEDMVGSKCSGSRSESGTWHPCDTWDRQSNGQRLRGATCPDLQNLSGYVEDNELTASFQFVRKSIQQPATRPFQVDQAHRKFNLSGGLLPLHDGRKGTLSSKRG